MERRHLFCQTKHGFQNSTGLFHQIIIKTQQELALWKNSTGVKLLPYTIHRSSLQWYATDVFKVSEDCDQKKISFRQDINSYENYLLYIKGQLSQMAKD